MKSDTDIQQDILNQLKFDPFLEACEIGVSVKNGIVTLSGKVQSYLEKIEAEKSVKKVSGVRAVALDIQVGVSPNNYRTDTEIAEAVLNTLKWHTSIPEENITIRVENGIVTLTGEVDWEYQRSAVKNAVSSLAGVSNVINLVKVKPGSVAEDIHQKINNAFHRLASIDADRISVYIQGNKVILSGKVHSYLEKEDAESAAWAAPGIEAVESRLEVVEKQQDEVRF